MLQRYDGPTIHGVCTGVNGKYHDYWIDWYIMYDTNAPTSTLYQSAYVKSNNSNYTNFNNDFNAKYTNIDGTDVQNLTKGFDTRSGRTVLIGSQRKDFLVSEQKHSIGISSRFGTVTSSLTGGTVNKDGIDVTPAKADIGFSNITTNSCVAQYIIYGSVDEIYYNVNGGEFVPLSSDHVISGLSSGTTYTLGLRFRNSNNGFYYWSYASITTLPDKITNFDAYNVTIDEGKSVQYNPNIQPTNALNKKLNFISDNLSVAQTDSTYMIYGISKGTATIHASTTDGSNIAKNIDVTVIRKVKGIQSDAQNISLKTGENVQLSYSIVPDGANNQGISFVSQNTNIATVSSTGVVTGIDYGTTTITATTNDGNYSIVFTIEVIGTMTWNDMGAFGKYINYYDMLAVYRNLQYLRQGFIDKGYSITAFTTLNFITKEYDMIDNDIRTSLAQLEGNIDKLYTSVKAGTPSIDNEYYVVKKAINANTKYTRYDFNRWINICNKYKSILDGWGT